MSAAIASARCLDLSCDWWTDQPGLALLGGESQRHADATGHAVYLTYTIPARAGCDPVFDGGKHYLPDVRSDIPRPVCLCTSDDLDRTPCPVHGKAA